MFHYLPFSLCNLWENRLHHPILLGHRQEKDKSCKHVNVSIAIFPKLGGKKRKLVPWSITFCFPLIDSMADFKVFTVIWKSLNSCFPNRLSSAKPRTRCSTETYESPYSFLKSRALCIRASKSRPNIDPGSSPNTWIIELNIRQLWPGDMFFAQLKATYRNTLKNVEFIAMKKTFSVSWRISPSP